MYYAVYLINGRTRRIIEAVRCSNKTGALDFAKTLSRNNRPTRIVRVVERTNLTDVGTTLWQRTCSGVDLR